MPRYLQVLYMIAFPLWYWIMHRRERWLRTTHVNFLHQHQLPSPCPSIIIINCCCQLPTVPIGCTLLNPSKNHLYLIFKIEVGHKKKVWSTWMLSKVLRWWNHFNYGRCDVSHLGRCSFYLALSTRNIQKTAKISNITYALSLYTKT